MVARVYTSPTLQTVKREFMLKLKESPEASHDVLLIHVVRVLIRATIFTNAVCFESQPRDHGPGSKLVSKQERISSASTKDVCTGNDVSWWGQVLREFEQVVR